MEEEFNVNIPEEKFKIIEFNREDLPGIAIVNSNLARFEPKEIFMWHCTVTIKFKASDPNKVLSQDENKALDDFGYFLDNQIKGADKGEPNALFFAKSTWNETRELIWRVYDPEIANNLLTGIVESREYYQAYDYKIEPDEDWELTQHLLK